MNQEAFELEVVLESGEEHRQLLSVEAALKEQQAAMLAARLATRSEEYAKGKWANWLAGGTKLCVTVRSGELQTVLTKAEMKKAGWVK